MTAVSASTGFRLGRILRTAVRALLAHKLRSALSILGIVCGVMAVLAMLAIGEGAKREALRQIERLGTRNLYLKAVPLTAGQTYLARRRLSAGLSAADGDRIREACRAVDAVAALKGVPAKVAGADSGALVLAVTPDIAVLHDLRVDAGRFILAQDVAASRPVCVLGSAIARHLGPAATPGRRLRIDDQLFAIVGILKDFNRIETKSAPVALRNYNTAVFIPLGLDGFLGAAANRDAPAVDELIVRVAASDQVSAAAAVIARTLAVAHHGVPDVEMVVPQELLRQVQRTRRLFNIILGTIAGISLLVGGIGIMNIMLATVSERTREIGIRRAVGATRSHIALQFLTEAVILTVTGGVAGVFGGVAAAWLVTAVAGWETAIRPLAVFLPLSVSLLVGVAFGLYPACRAAFMDPIAALRHV